MIFRNPAFLWLLPLAMVPLYLEFIRRRRAGVFEYSTADDAVKAPGSWRATGRRALALLRAASIALAIIAMARPQSGDEQSKVRVEGIAIQLVVDRSGSMSEADLLYDGQRMQRLDAARRVIDQFVRGRKDDLIGLTTFSAYPDEVCPFTLDYGMLSKFFEQVRPDGIFPYTAIGDGILHAANLLKESTAKSKVMILLTDGANNFGVANPVEAARMAAQLGIRIYSIGIVPNPSAQSAVGVFSARMLTQGASADEDTLRQVADAGNGRYFSAPDADRLREIYDEINRLEKSEQVTEKYLQYREHFHAPLSAALGLTCLESFFGLTFFRRKP